MSSPYEIKVVESSKDGLKEGYPKGCQDGIIPCPNTSTIIIGSAGSGKTVLLQNLLSNPNMLGGYFDKNNIFVLSETGETDDVMRSLEIPEENTFEDLKKGITHLKKIMKINKAIIKAVGADKAPQLCLVYDDCINNKDLLKDEFFKRSFIANRHFNLTVFILTQHYKAVPKVCREQTTNTIMFQSNEQTNFSMAEIFTPPGYTKKEFIKMIDIATRPKYSFLFINKKEPFESRYRIKFEEILYLDRLNEKEAKDREIDELKEKETLENKLML